MNDDKLLSIRNFCEENSISRSLFYRLVNDGRGPRLTHIGRRTLISSNAAAVWRKRMEQESVKAETN
jgi:predicted DNA-binding transcriptional regulator AlpA